MDIPLINLGDETMLIKNESLDDKRQLQTLTLLCNACLCVGRTLHKVTDDKMARFYLDTLREIPLCDVPAICPSVCWECKASLRRVASFKEQVKDSYRLLQTYSNRDLHDNLLNDVVRPSQLQIRSQAPISYIPDTEVEKNTQTEMDCTESMFVKDELLTEWNGKESPRSSTPVDDGPISDSLAQELEPEFSEKKKKRKCKIQSKIKRAEKVVKRLRDGVKNQKKSKTTDNQKILTIELSYEEMQAEREKEALKESYLKAPFKCESCLLGFTYRRSFKAHHAAKHNSDLGNYICPICKTIISSLESFTSHYKRHMRRYECGLCGKRTLDVKVMQQHYYSRHEIALKRYTCDLCGKVSNSIDTHRYHKDTHKARVQCGDCDKTFTHRAGLLNHRLSVHELHNSFPCTECDKVFRWKTSLKRHLEKHGLKECSSGEAAHCDSCRVSFASLSSLQRHLRSSLKHVTRAQLRFICAHCNRRFADKTKLRDHIEEKHLHKTYQCHICLKPSKNRVALDQHVRNVHKGRPHNKICHHCAKAFPTKVQLESHIRTHTGERPFICEFCPTTFSQQSNLYKHNRQVHLNIKSKRYPNNCRKRPQDPAPPALPAHPAPPYTPGGALLM